MRYLLALTLLVSVLAIYAQQTNFLVFDFNHFNTTTDPLQTVPSSLGSGILSNVSGTGGVIIRGNVTTERFIHTTNYPQNGSSYSDGIKITASTVGYDNIVITWTQNTLQLAANRLRLRYTIDGENWIDFVASEENALNYCNYHEENEAFDNGLYKTPHGSARNLGGTSTPENPLYSYLRSADFSGITGIEDNPLFKVQFVTAYPPGSNVYEPANPEREYDPSVAIQYDNIIFSGEPIPLPASNIATLRSVQPNTGTRYRFIGFMTVTMVSDNKIYVQDATAGILLIDDQNLISAPYAIGDILTGFVGVVAVEDGMLTFILKTEPNNTDSGAPLTPIAVTIPSLLENPDNYQARLVKLSNVYFTTTEDFTSNTLYQLTGENNSSYSFKTIFADADYIETTIPVTFQNIIGLVSTDADRHFITARSMADFSDVYLPPRNLTATINGYIVSLEWQAPLTPQGEVQGYRVFRQNTLLTEDLITTLTYEDTAPDYGYYTYYVVAIYTGDFSSTPSNTVNAFVARLNSPRNLVGNQIEDAVSLNWSAPQDESYLGTFQYYKIYRNESLIASPITSASYTDNDVEIGSTYTYHVTAKYVQGESTPSNTQTITLEAGVEYLPPTNLNVAVTGLDVHLQWVAPVNPTATVLGYNVYRNSAQVNESLVTTVTFTNTTPEYGNYAYHVTAVYADSESIPSNICNVFVARLNPPQSLTVQQVEMSASLSWSAPNNESHLGTFQYYKVYRNGDVISPNTLISTSFTDNDVVVNTAYTYKITAQYVQGESIASNEVSITLTSATEYLPPTNLTSTVNILTVTLQWLAPTSANVTGYNVYRNAVQINESIVSSLSYDDTVPDYGNYTYHVTALYAGNESIPSNTAQVFVARLNPPRELSSLQIEDYVSLSWFVPLVEEHLGTFQYYKIYRNNTLISAGTVMGVFYSDYDVQTGNSYTYHVTAKYAQGESVPSNTSTISLVSEDDETAVPIQTILIGNYPNPFNPETTIYFMLSHNSQVEITIYNLKGQKIKSLINGGMMSGTHRFVWNGTDELGYPVSSGVYLYQMKTDDYMSMRKLILMK